MRKISLIVIHCSATRADRDFTAKDVDTAHRFRGFSCWGYHYYIRKSGQIEPMRDEDTVGAHARGFNAISLGCAMKAGWMRTERQRIRVLPARKNLCIAWCANCCSVIRMQRWSVTGT